jgi:hypothetical protein
MSCVSHPSLVLHRIAMLSGHSCPLVPLGGRQTGGMNVYYDGSGYLSHPAVIFL